MITVTSQQIVKFRAELSAYPDALKALDILEECEGDLDYAVKAAAIEVGMLSDELADDSQETRLLQKCCPYLCTEAFKESLSQGFAAAIGAFMAISNYPMALATLIVLYVTVKNLDKFCIEMCKKS